MKNIRMRSYALFFNCSLSVSLSLARARAFSLSLSVSLTHKDLLLFLGLDPGDGTLQRRLFFHLLQALVFVV